MDKQAIFDAVQQIFRDNFNDPQLEIGRDTCADDVEGWDSIEQINLLTACENRFSVKFKLSDIRRLQNVGDLLDLIERLTH